MASSDSSDTVQSVVIMLIQRIPMIYLSWLGLAYSHVMFLNCPNDLLIHLSIAKFLHLPGSQTQSSRDFS